MGSDLVLRQRLQERGLLERFTDRAIAWAEELDIRWIELEGEPWTLVSELERKKGVEAGDFVRDSRLKPAHEVKPQEPPAALQRLLQVPGVRRASIPTAFAVEGGYALSCGGPGAKDGITAMVRRQIPQWALAGYTLVNVPLALAYLQHGRSDVAKATRDLTIGTTIDVGKEAAAQDSASIAVQMIGGFKNPEVAAAFQSLALALAADSERAHTRLDVHDQEIQEVKQDLRQLKSSRARPRSVKVKKADRDLLFSVWDEHYSGLCPRCNEPVRRKDLEVEHWTNRDIADREHIWLTCRPCNTDLGEPVGNGGKKRMGDDERAFHTFQDLLRLRCKQTVGVQMRLVLP